MIVLLPSQEAATRPSTSAILQLFEIHTVVLPEGIVFGDQDRTFEILRDPFVTHPLLNPPR